MRFSRWVRKFSSMERREAQIKAAMDISKERNRLADEDVISPLVSMLQSRDHEAIEAALCALLNLTFRSQRNKIRIAKSELLPALVVLLTEESNSSTELAIAALLTLSTCNENKSIIVATGAVPLLVGFFGRYGDGTMGYISLQARLDAIDTLQNLLTYDGVDIPLIISNGAIFSLLQMIFNFGKSSKAVEKTLALLEKIASLSEIGLTQIVGVQGGILALVETIEEGSQQSREHAAGILLYICKNSREKYRELILREGAIPGLLQLCVDGTRRAKDIARALLLMLRDTADYGLSRELGNGLFEQIMREIDTDEVVADATMRLVENMITNFSV